MTTQTTEGDAGEGQQDGQEPQPAGEAGAAALAQQLNREREARRAAQGKLAEFEAKLKDFDGIDPTAVREVLEEKKRLEEEARKNNPAKLEEFHKQEKQRLIDDYEARLKETLAKVEQLQKTNKTLTVTDKVMANIGKHFNEDVQDIVKSLVERHCDIDESGQIFIVGEDGKEMPSAKNAMLPMTVEEFGLWLVEKKPSLAKPTGMGGTRDPNQGERSRRLGTKLPSSMQELFAMPGGRDIWAKMSAEEKAQLGATWKMG